MERAKTLALICQALVCAVTHCYSRDRSGSKAAYWGKVQLVDRNQCTDTTILKIPLHSLITVLHWTICMMNNIREINIVFKIVSTCNFSKPQRPVICLKCI